jgi:hypothetical protein
MSCRIAYIRITAGHKIKKKEHMGTSTPALSSAEADEISSVVYYQQ